MSSEMAKRNSKRNIELKCQSKLLEKTRVGGELYVRVGP